MRSIAEMRPNKVSQLKVRSLSTSGVGSPLSSGCLLSEARQRDERRANLTEGKTITRSGRFCIQLLYRESDCPRKIRQIKVFLSMVLSRKSNYQKSDPFGLPPHFESMHRGYFEVIAAGFAS